MHLLEFKNFLDVRLKEHISMPNAADIMYASGAVYKLCTLFFAIFYSPPPPLGYA